VIIPLKNQQHPVYFEFVILFTICARQIIYIARYIISQALERNNKKVFLKTPISGGSET
jgi:hypothetical protein